MLGYGVSHVLVDAAEARLLTQALPPAALGATNGARMSRAGGDQAAGAAGRGRAVRLGRRRRGRRERRPALVVSAVLYALVRTGRRTAEEPRRRLGSEQGGTAVLWREPRVRTPVLVAAIAMAASGLGSAAIYAVVVDRAAPAHPRSPACSRRCRAPARSVGGLVTGRLLRRWGETRGRRGRGGRYTRSGRRCRRWLAAGGGGRRRRRSASVYRGRSWRG
jgi:hypothetical protein